MSYHGYIPFISQYALNISKEKKLKVLEIGLLYGASCGTINNNLNILGIQNYHYVGVDVLITQEVRCIQQYSMVHSTNKFETIEQNSIDYLNNCEEVFDIILLDGDHNYDTVKKECKNLTRIMHDDTLIIFDDYHGKFTNSDYFYKTMKPTHKHVTSLTDPVIHKDFTGVKPAVDQFVEQNGLLLFTLMDGCPVCVIGKNNKYIKLKESEEADKTTDKHERNDDYR